MYDLLIGGPQPRGWLRGPEETRSAPGEVAACGRFPFSFASCAAGLRTRRVMRGLLRPQRGM